MWWRRYFLRAILRFVHLFSDSESASLKNLRKKLKPRRETAQRVVAQWQADFVDYLRSECHLAENTVVAYDRDLTRFFAWLGNRRLPELRVSDLAGLPGLAGRAIAWPPRA